VLLLRVLEHGPVRRVVEATTTAADGHVRV